MAAVQSVICNETGCIKRSSMTFIWKISDFFVCPLSYNESVSSEKFSFDNITCSLKAESSKSKTGYLGVYVEIETGPLPPNKILSVLTVKNKRGQDCLISARFVSNGSYTAFPCLMRSVASNFLQNNCLTIVLELTRLPFVQNRTENGKNVVPSKPPSNCFEDLSRDFGRLLTSKQNADVLFQVEGQKIPAHSLILSARSSVFAAMLQHNMAERRTGVIKIVDCGESTINCLLRYMYAGEIPDITDLSSALLTELYTVADKYAIIELKNMCSHVMASNLSENSVKVYATLAQKYNDQLLIGSIVSFFAKRSMLVNSELWTDLKAIIPGIAGQVLNAVVKGVL